ncbi:MAG: iron-containing redox enzyme family protein [Nitrososphaera sp.]|uniref:TenA family transcriptional regulator n=1 Tax=Nitrososphaera sp. TaxID=1971748 RepID=UPI00180F2667|nr:iron-containing redox enzyme family protein [Nitrososphaera sp.]NWG38053.1 iron-containing redox enzyme family protein [Nitrososphaera sp.]
MENSLVERIDAEVEKRSLLKHPFYQMWSEGKLTVDHLQGYSKEYFQLVKAVPTFVQNIASFNTDATIAPEIEGNMKEESEHVEPWTRFARALGVPLDELTNYAGASKTNEAVAKIMALSRGSFEEAVAAMYAFESELPKISRSKIDGLVKFYGLDGKDALNYFEIHEEADIRHAQTWRSILASLPADRQERAFAAAVESLKAQNLLLDSVQEKYVGVYC